MIHVYVVCNVFFFFPLLYLVFLVGKFVYDQMGLVRVLFCSYLALHVLGVDCAIVVLH